jgi:hypothetical protein
LARCCGNIVGSDLVGIDCTHGKPHLFLWVSQGLTSLISNTLHFIVAPRVILVLAPHFVLALFACQLQLCPAQHRRLVRICLSLVVFCLLLFFRDLAFQFCFARQQLRIVFCCPFLLGCAFKQRLCFACQQFRRVFLCGSLDLGFVFACELLVSCAFQQLRFIGPLLRALELGASIVAFEQCPGVFLNVSR